MKKYFLHFTTALFCGAALLISSCETKDDTDAIVTEPTFPVAVTPTIAAGDTYAIAIDVDRDWEIEIPTTGASANWFWIEDGTQRVYKVRGTAGKSTITIGTLNQQEYDNVHSCEVTMTQMGSNKKPISKVIATISLGKVVRELAIYSSKVYDENFTPNPDSETTKLTYDYNTTTTESIALQWLEGKSGHLMPIMIEGNFKWSVVSELPEWLSLTKTQGEAAVKTETMLAVVPGKYPLDGAKATLQIGTAEKSFPLVVSVEATRELFRTNFPVKSIFNHKGFLLGTSNTYTDASARGVIVSAKGLVLRVFAEVKQWGSSYLSDEPSDNAWVTTKDNWDESYGLVQSRNVEVRPIEHAGEPRNAIVLGIPKSINDALVAAGTFVADAMEIREEYKKYIITSVHQESDPGPLSVSMNKEELAKMFAKFDKLGSDEQDYKDVFWTFAETKNIYRMTYAENWSEEDWNLIFNTPYTSFKCFNHVPSADDFSELLPDDNTSWLRFNSTSSRVTMKPKMNAKSKGIVAFYDADSNLIAAILCIFDKDTVFDAAEGPSFVYPGPAADDGSSLMQLTSGEIYDQYAEFGVPVWQATFTKKAATMSHIKDLTPNWSRAEGTGDWLMSEFVGEYSTISYTTPGTGALLYYKDADKTALSLILVCTATY